MPFRRIQRVMWVCAHCDYEWFPRAKMDRQRRPKQCPNCHRYDWDDESAKPPKANQPLVEVLKDEAEEVVELDVSKRVGNFPTVEKPSLFCKTIENGHIIEPIVTPIVPEDEKV